jgi:hypothetical protein
VKSLTHNRLGLVAVNWRWTRSGARVAAGSATVVRLGLPRTAPAIPRLRISRATRSRPTATPSRRSCFQTLRAP